MKYPSKEELVKNELTDIQKLLVMLNLFYFKLPIIKDTEYNGYEYELTSSILSIFNSENHDKLLNTINEKINNTELKVKFIESRYDRDYSIYPIFNYLGVYEQYNISICFYDVGRNENIAKSFIEEIDILNKLSKELAVEVADEIISYKDILCLFSKEKADLIKNIFDMAEKKIVIKKDIGFFKLEF